MFNPVGERILVRDIEDDERQTSTGIYIAGNEEHSAPKKAEVIGIGNTKERDLGITIGDIVMFPRYSGTDVTIEGEDLILVDYDNVLVKVI
jgi:chaperonin GroES